MTQPAMEPLNRLSPAEPQASLWSRALWLILACTALRLIYLIWLTPYELVGDEAYYWVQSQHLDWSYREKGPLLAWMIAGCCKLFGNTEWAVRLPMVISSAVSAWAVGRLTLAVTKRDQRAALLAVAIFLLIPAFQANAQICTQDGPLILLIVGMTAAGLKLVRRWEAGQSTWGAWLALWFLFGVGVLLKQSVLLFGSALLVYVVIRRKQLNWRPSLIAQQLAGLIVFFVTISPILIWEHRNGWPMLGHTLGHLGFAGDRPQWTQVKGNRLGWVAATVGGIVGSVGPAALLLMGWASLRQWKRRRENPQAWPDQLWLMCAGWPSVLFFVGLSFIKQVVPSWPLPSVVPLVVSGAWMLSEQWDALVKRTVWKRLRRSGAIAVEKPAKQTEMLGACWTILWIYGVIGWLVMSFPNGVTRIPFVSTTVKKSVISRIANGKERALELQKILETVRTPDGKPPVIVATHYSRASLYSFYLPPGHPTVTCSGVFSGRPNNFDNWSETRLDGPDMRGRTLLLVDSSAKTWNSTFKFDNVELIQPRRPEVDYFLGTNFQGPRGPQAGTNPSSPGHDPRS